MTKQDKLIERLKSQPRDFTWQELLRLLKGLGYKEVATGKTGGSRKRFVHETAPTITLHKPHPGNIVKSYVIKAVLQTLVNEGIIK